MDLIPVLLLSITLGISPPDVKPVLNDECSRLELSYSEQEVSNKDQIKIELQAKGGSDPYYYIFLDSKGNPLTWEFKQNAIVVDKNKIPSYGKVVDSKGCTKTINLIETERK